MYLPNGSPEHKEYLNRYEMFEKFKEDESSVIDTRWGFYQIIKKTNMWKTPERIQCTEEQMKLDICNQLQFEELYYGN